MPLSTDKINCLQNAIAKRQLLTKATNAIRLVDGIADKLDGLVLERYNHHFVLQVFNPFWLKEKQSLKSFIAEHFDVHYLILKDRTQSASSDAKAIPFQILAGQDSKTIVRENGLNFEVDLNDTLNTGLFLDMRANRQLVKGECEGKRVLNCFAYTCSFGVYARSGKAQEVVNVDVSKRILERGQRNYELNGLEPSRIEFIKADVLDYLTKGVEKSNMFDIIILDPPSFARMEGKVFTIEKDLPKLIALASKVLTEEGKLFVSTNFSGMTHGRLEEILRVNSKPRSYRKSTHLGQDTDFTSSGKTKESHLCAIWAEG